jgi:hypothetical protein
MFIPKGKAVYENLATSFVLIDALIEELCEGGLSGIVEVVVGPAQFDIIIDGGEVEAAIKRDLESDAFSPSSVADVAAAARRERGRVSVYSHRPGATAALAGRLTAEALYTGLSTDFADLEKMIAKLSRETDRQWFIELRPVSGESALIHLDRGQCQVIGPLSLTAEQDSESSVKQIVEHCSRAGCTFDVYFKRAVVVEEMAPAMALLQQAETSPSGVQEQIEPPTRDSELPPEPVQEPLPAVETPFEAIAAEDIEGWQLSLDEEPGTITVTDVESALPEPLFREAAASAPAIAAVPLAGDNTSMSGLSLSQGTAEEEEAMAEVKALMGEIARTIDDATRTVEQRDCFPMYLRAGQLKIADRYPFLDPFGAEFEYLEGEIVFVGKASPEEFVEGVTEGLRLAVTAVIQASNQPTRLRGHITEELRALLARLWPELQRFGLERSVDHIITV